MVSPRRQGHIVATLPKKGIRQVQEYDVKQLPSISPPPRTANQYLAADSAAQDDGEYTTNALMNGMNAYRRPSG